MKLKTLILHTAVLAGLTMSAHAGSIGVNVGPNDPGNIIGTTTTAGVVAQDNWNNLLGGNVPATAVTDNSGTLLATTVQVQTQWSYQTSAGGSGGDQILMNSALDNGGGEMGFVVQNIPYALYDVIIYHEGASNQGRGGAFFIRDTDNGNTIVATQNSYDVTNFDGTFVDASTVGTPAGSGLDGNGDPINSNYVRFSGLTLANIGIRSDGANPPGIGTDRAPITGMQIVEAGADVIAPTPDPMTFASVPAAVGDSQVTMTATTANDTSDVEYYFTETSGNPGGSDSGWQDSETYTDTELNPGTTYTYTVKARDKSPAQNETADSGAASATTDAPDLAAPTPNPSTWDTVPTANGQTEITMTATAATDISGVEYYFAETSGNPGGDDSGWQDSPTYTDGGLTADTTYTYTVKTRDKSSNQNETTPSSAESATTDAAPVFNAIAVNVGPNDPGNIIGTTTTAGVVAQDNWNNLLGGNVGATPVTDNSGTLLATTVQVQTQWSYQTSAGGSGGDQILMNSALDNGGGEMGFVVQNIPYALYDVIIYHEGASNEGRGGAFFIRDTDNGNTIVATQNSYDVTNFDGTFVDASTVGTPAGSGLDGNGDPINSNYVRFSGLTLANIGIRSDGANPPGIGTDRAPIAGMQIVQASATPEDGFSGWIAGFPGVGGDTGFDDDPDGDGNGNGLENFFGTAPDEYSAGLVVGMISGGTATLSHPQNATPADDVSGPTYEWSKDLVTFYASGESDGSTTVTFAPSVDNPVAGTTTVSATVTGDAAPAIFMRVRVTLTP